MEAPPRLDAAPKRAQKLTPSPAGQRPPAPPVPAAFRAPKDPVKIRYCTESAALAAVFEEAQGKSTDEEFRMFCLCLMDNVKPEQMAKARQELAHAQAMQEGGHKLKGCGLELDLITRELSCGVMAVKLSNRDIQLLGFLMRHPGEAVSGEQLMAEIWDGAALGGSNIVSVYIGRLRKLIGSIGGDKTAIHTQIGVGYTFNKGTK